MSIESISTPVLNDSNFQYETIEVDHVEQTDPSLDINDKWKQGDKRGNVSLNTILINKDKRTLNMRLFFRGEIGTDELKECIMEIIQKAYDYVREEGYLDKEDQISFLNSLFITLKMEAVQLASAENFLEGRAMSKKYGTSDDKILFCKWNSFGFCGKFRAVGEETEQRRLSDHVRLCGLFVFWSDFCTGRFLGSGTLFKKFPDFLIGTYIA